MLFRVLGIVGHAFAERITNRRPSTRHDIPSSLESLNVAWLTDVLCAKVPHAEVIDFQLGERDDGSTNRRRLSLQYNATGEAAGLPRSLFIKAAMSISNRISAGATGTMLTECEFYNRIRPLLDIEAPVARHAANDPVSCRAIMLLEDLVATRGATFLDPADYIDRNRAESVVDLLADFHGRFLGRADEFNALPTWEEMIAAIAKIAMIGRYTRIGLAAAEDVVPESLRRRVNEVWPATQRVFELGRGNARTLTHNDVHIKNWYLTRDGVTGLADWQCTARGPLTRDLAYSIAAALTVEDRRNWERDLIARYLDRLHAVSGTRLAFDETFHAYRQQMLSALALWTPVISPPPYMPAMQPKATSRTYIQRLTCAIDDLESLAAAA